MRKSVQMFETLTAKPLISKLDKTDLFLCPRMLGYNPSNHRSTKQFRISVTSRFEISSVLICVVPNFWNF